MDKHKLAGNNHRIRKSMHINSSRVYLHDFAEQAARTVPPGSLVLDAGAGHAPYQALFAHTDYETADFGQVDDLNYAPITYVCDLADIPVEDNRYDLVFCSQVLEHLPEPGEVLKELYRVLKPGKELWLTTPLFYEEHQVPFDFYRYTRYGLTYQLEKAGFQVKNIEWLEGYYGTLSQQLRSAGGWLPRQPSAYGGGLSGGIAALAAVMLKPLFRALALWFERLDLRYKNDRVGLCKNYRMIAIKPGQE